MSWGGLVSRLLAMKNTALTLLALLVLLPTGALAAKQVTFQHQPMRAGETIASVDNMTLNMQMEVAFGDEKGSFHADQVEIEERTSTLGPVWSAKEKQATIAYLKHESTEKQTSPDGQVAGGTKPDPVAGKSYRVHWTEGAEPQVILEDGSSISAEEQSTVVADFNELADDELDALDVRLVGNTFKVGDVSEADLNVLASLMQLDSDDDLVLTEGQVLLKDLIKHNGDRCAVFGLTATLGARDPEVKLTMRVKGEVLVSAATLRPYSMTLSGPMEMSMDGNQAGVSISMKGTGEVTGSMTFQYGQAPK